MSEPRKTNGASDDAIDWAEKLKASMHESPAETHTSEPTPAAEEDDLAALLRAQLAHGDTPVKTAFTELDTSEFEMAAEEIGDDPAEEIGDDPAEEIGDDPAEEIGDEPAEEIEDDPAEEIGDEPVEEIGDEPAEEYGEAMAASASASCGEAVPSGEAPSPRSIYPDEDRHLNDDRHLDDDRHLSDDRLNGLFPDEMLGGRRLAALDEKNTRLLAERKLLSEVQEEAVGSAEPLPTDENGMASTGGETSGCAAASREDGKRERDRGRAVAETPTDACFHDPLQLGLDDILPPSAPKPASAPRHANAPRPSSLHPLDYTEAMTERDGAKESLQDTDLHLGLGYETDLRRKDDADRVEQARERRAAATPIAGGDAIVVNGGREYCGRAEADRIRTDYVRARRGALIRLCIAATGALFGILYDLLGVMTQRSDILTFTASPAYPIIGVLWLVLFSLPFLSRLGKGFKSLLDFEPTRYAVAAPALLVTALNGGAAILARTAHLFGGAALLMLTVAALAEYLAVWGEADAFAVVSAGKTTHILTDEPTPAAEERRRTLPEGTRVLTAVRVGRISDYFARTCRYNPYMGYLNYLLPVALLAAILGAGLSVLRGGTLIGQGIPVFTATYLACLPAAYLLSMSLPLCLTNRLLSRKGAAVIGAATPLEYADGKPTHLMLSDGDVLLASCRKDISLRGDKRAAEWRALADALFRLLNTPLAVEPVLRRGDLRAYRINVAEWGEEYIRLYLTDRETEQAIEVLAGSHAALKDRGVRLPALSMEHRYKKSEESHVLYLAFNRSFHMAYSSEYRVGSTFLRVAEALSSLSCGVSLFTYDPLVNPNMKDLASLRRHTAVEVVRLTSHEPPRRTRSSGLAATGRSTDLLHPLAACHRMRKSYRIAHILSWIGLLLGFGLTAVAILAGWEPLLSSALVTLLQLVSAVASVGLCMGIIHRRSLFMTPPPSQKPPKENPSDEASQ